MKRSRYLQVVVVAASASFGTVSVDTQSGAQLERVGAPQVLSTVAPAFPQLARRDVVAYRLNYELVVGEDGAVREVRPQGSDSEELRPLHAAAVPALMQWRFVPEQRLRPSPTGGVQQAIP